jgi:hypothetical protein
MRSPESSEIFEDFFGGFFDGFFGGFKTPLHFER